MEIVCVRCDQTFDAATFRGYCDACLTFFTEQKEAVHQRRSNKPGVILDGKFANESPQSVTDEIADVQVCGICGGDDLSHGYGLGSGYGMGSYTFCEDCYAFLDFCEDME